MTRPALLPLVATWLVLGCFGGQSKQAREQSARVGDQSAAVPPETRQEHDWKKAAQGRGAAGPFDAEDLARMEEESAPGGNLTARDGGH
jgi:hypothetical protein